MQTAFLFTGQGSQFVGMGKDLIAEFDEARQTFAQADAVLGQSLTQLCLEGPEDDLRLTENTQPATLTVSIAALRALMGGGELPENLRPDAAAGHSLGEYTALTAAGAFQFEDAVQLVRDRATAMQQAVPDGTGGMVVLRKMDLAEVEELVAKVDAGVCEVANHNAPGQIVVSGAAAAMDQLAELAGGRRAMRLQVSVPFHCSLLQPAAEQFAGRLDQTSMQDPVWPIYCNVDGTPVREAAAARDALRRQFAGAVLWQKSIETMLQDGVRRFFEFGPKAILLRMVTQIANLHDIEGVETVPVTTAAEIAALRG